ncbi:MAG: GntR family transcriptional regulator [Bacteroides sp.]|nr:GntR family transcriptional regulator [Bacteroides sp.]MBD5415863.1 GntR family transcriptional regulator [Bacteroides sp.]MBD5425636.1 GntR family transcriptional regulator [Bacteroides sp.]
MKEFSADKPIFRQVADHCIARIRSGAWAASERIPSTKELAVELAVNNRTVMKAYDDLSDSGIIFQRRGLGYYVAPDASERITAFFRREFINSTVPELRRKLELSGISPEELLELLK